MSTVVNAIIYLETFTFRDDSGTLVTTAVNGDFTKTVICNGATSAVACTVAQVSTSGRYTPSLTPDAVGDWTVIVEWTADPTFAWSYNFRVITAAQSDPVGALSGVSVTVTSPVASNGDVTFVAGDAVSLPWSSTTWADLTADTVTFQAYRLVTDTAVLATAKTATLTSQGQATQHATVTLTGVDTALFAPGTAYRYELTSLAHGRLAAGALSAREG